MTLIPPNGYLAPTLWDMVLAPDPRLAQQTATYGLPMNITSLVSATNYLVRVNRPADSFVPHELGIHRGL